MNDTTDSTRLDELESRLAFQDDVIESLNEIVARQDQELVRLGRRLAALEAKIAEVAASNSSAAAESYEPPPHY
ncbi:MAG: SlyX family protein [Xanthomonadales bacterium]|nr:SlyX family protein [Gammaproteobacteria bacterium]MBT8057779.1 SlyX family protein [Gammaproteobacteria bacterium]NNJ77788.1 SlyX family protein [Xanthomonadales bacterium]NNL04673.1 SlyX family protein [Xanthomonadales bacterium]